MSNLLNVNVGDFILFRKEICGSLGLVPLGNANAKVIAIFVSSSGKEVYRTDYPDNEFQAVYEEQVLDVYKPKGEP